MTDAERAKIVGRPVLLYDGVCALCNGVVRFLLKRDGAAMFRFAPLQSELAAELMGGNEPMEGVVLVTDAVEPGQRIYRRSDAVAEALRLLGGGWSGMGSVLAMVPRVLREAGYGVVAQLRYRVFGRYAVCPLPRAEERERFVGLDAGKIV